MIAAQLGRQLACLLLGLDSVHGVMAGEQRALHLGVQSIRCDSSTANGHDFCARSVEVTVINGKRSVRSHTVGNCSSPSAAPDAAVPSGTASGKSI